MSEMISVASGFQYSVNIGYDLNNDAKLKNFIPTQSALQLLSDVLDSTAVTSTERSRILIGAYGKGKSHIVLMILSMLLKKDLSLFEKTMPKISENPRLLQSVHNYYDSSEKILPVVITGSSTSLTQAFIIALQRTLSDNGLLDIMPETNYRAAIAVIDRWKSEFPQTYKLFCNAIDKPVGVFLDELASFNISAYEAFERIYPSLTAGSTFNPFLGFDVVDLYESVAKSLKEYGYTGLYVVYDEFSKYLEANIKEASVSDTKTLQDFAEKCNRSGSMQLHLMLISHKEISNYIDTLPKQKVDGWRGVSERFKHIHLNNNFSQTYEIIASVIQKEPTKWARFQKNHQKDLEELLGRYKNHPLFSANSTELETAIMGCYPLHPVSTFILPRLSERVAQNERTLFTFLSAEGTSTLRSFIDVYDPVHKREGYFSTYPLLKANGCIGCSELQDCSRAVNMVMDKLQCDEKEASSVILESIPVESIDTLIEFGLNNANDDYYDDVYLADGCSTCKTEIFRSFLTQVATNTDEIFFELSNKLLRQALDEQLSKLTLKEAEVIKLRYGYYGKERTLEEVGKQFGVTRERIRQIETKAIRKLRHPSRAKHLRDFL